MGTSITLTLIRGPTLLIEYDGLRLLTDPTFDPPGQYQGPHSPVRHVKTTGPALPSDQIGPLDAVLLSHDHHFDNLDNAGALCCQALASPTRRYPAPDVWAETRSVLRPS